MPSAALPEERGPFYGFLRLLNHSALSAWHVAWVVGGGWWVVGASVVGGGLWVVGCGWWVVGGGGVCRCSEMLRVLGSVGRRFALKT